MDIMRRIVILAGKLHAVGGVETHLFHFCRLLAEKGAEVSLIITSRAFGEVSKQRLRNAGVKLWEHDCGISAMGAVGYGQILLRLAKVGTSNTVFYSNGTSGFAQLARRIMRSRLWIHHHHTDVTDMLIRKFPRGYKKVLGRCDQLIACTAEHAQHLDTHFQRKGKTVFLPYCKDEPIGQMLFAPRPVGRPIVIGFFGRLRASKGIPVLLELAPWFHSNGFECRLHGDDCEHLLPAILPKGVSWVGPYAAGDSMDRLMADVDMLVLPTTFPEGLPLVITEAISRGIPVVSYDGGGVRNLASFHPGLMVIPPEREKLMEAILTMREKLKDSSLRQGLVEAYQKTLSNRVTLDWWMSSIG
jgi:glycosyltransferase involved in cell wall biosynthesis